MAAAVGEGGPPPEPVRVPLTKEARGTWAWVWAVVWVVSGCVGWLAVGVAFGIAGRAAAVVAAVGVGAAAGRAAAAATAGVARGVTFDAGAAVAGGTVTGGMPADFAGVGVTGASTGVVEGAVVFTLLKLPIMLFGGGVFVPDFVGVGAATGVVVERGTAKAGTGWAASSVCAPCLGVAS